MPMYTDAKYPSPRWPGYIKQARARSVEELLPVARVHTKREYAFPALGQVDKRDPDERWSCADGWREINDRLGPMLSDGIEYKVEATALRGHLERHPEYTAVYAGEAGGNHWRRTTSQRYRGSWLFST